MYNFLVDQIFDFDLIKMSGRSSPNQFKKKKKNYKNISELHSKLDGLNRSANTNLKEIRLLGSKINSKNIKIEDLEKQIESIENSINKSWEIHRSLPNEPKDIENISTSSLRNYKKKYGTVGSFIYNAKNMTSKLSEKLKELKKNERENNSIGISGK